MVAGMQWTKDGSVTWAWADRLDHARVDLAGREEPSSGPRSRNDNDLGSRYPAIVKARAPLPDDIVIDGEVVALDETGRPSFNISELRLLESAVLYYVFDVLVIGGRDVMGMPLSARREMVERRILATLGELHCYLISDLPHACTLFLILFSSPLCTVCPLHFSAMGR
jgi:ATP-dependent DNA ligase